METFIIFGGSVLIFIACLTIQGKLSARQKTFGWASVINLAGLLLSPPLLIFLAAYLYPQGPGGGIGWLLVAYVIASPFIAVIAFLLLYRVHKKTRGL